MNIDQTTPFSSLKLDTAQLGNYLTGLNVDPAVIQKVLNDPSIKILDVISAEQAKTLQTNLEPPKKGGNFEDVKPRQYSDLTQLFLALLELLSKQNELEQLQAKNALLSNKSTMDTSKESNRLTAKAERWNAIATIAGGFLQVGASAVAFRTLSPKAPKTAVVAESVGNSSILAQKAMTYNSLGQAGSGLISGFTSLFTTGTAQEGKNKAAEAEYIKSNSDSIRSSIAALQKLMDSAQSSAGMINNMMSSVARY
jgi:hypothetical protein